LCIASVFQIERVRQISLNAYRIPKVHIMDGQGIQVIERSHQYIAVLPVVGFNRHCVTSITFNFSKYRKSAIADRMTTATADSFFFNYEPTAAEQKARKRQQALRGLLLPTSHSTPRPMTKAEAIKALQVLEASQPRRRERTVKNGIVVLTERARDELGAFMREETRLREIIQPPCKIQAPDITNFKPEPAPRQRTSADYDQSQKLIREQVHRLMDFYKPSPCP
jgi:hypothetical protein